jgi:hypothetical protein
LTRTLQFFVALFLLPGVSHAYEQETHRRITEAVVEQSILGRTGDVSAETKRDQLGLPAATSALVEYPDSKSVSRSITRLIQFGAIYEDDALRAVNHFFDPRDGSALHLDPLRYPLPGILRDAIDDASMTSPDWALGMSGKSQTLAQEFSYADLKNYYFDALTNPDVAKRAKAYGRTFETVGRIVHHIQDMAQPQHVRNDAHVSDRDADNYCSNLSPDDQLGTLVCAAYELIRNPSVYEAWTLQLTSKFKQELPTEGYAPVYGSDPTDSSLFALPRMFWTNGGKGMADFTSTNFLSDGTMDQSPPDLGAQYEQTVATLCNGAVPSCGNVDLSRTVTFRSTTVIDKLRGGAPMPNPYAASWSIFTPDFSDYAPNASPPWTVNRFTIAYDHLYLIPRAVGYSAGFINYFFRGDMEITPPYEGIYAIADTNKQGCAGPSACGFSKVRMRLKNTTLNENIGAGKLLLVARYHSNDCYEASLAGEYGGPDFKGNGCRLLDEEIVVSDKIDIAQGDINSAPTLFEFQFKNGNIPLNASDLVLQAVFRGKLGAEDDAIVVSTKNVSEPNFMAALNVTDYVYDAGDKQYHQLPYKGISAPVYVNNVGVGFGQTLPGYTDATAPMISLPLLRAGEFARFAFIADRADLTATVFHDNVLDADWTIQPEEFVYDETNGYARSCRVFEGRGLYWEYFFFWNRLVGQNLAQDINTKSESADDSPGRLVKSFGKRRIQPKSSHTCFAPRGGEYDFTLMTPFDASQALPWTSLNF